MKSDTSTYWFKVAHLYKKKQVEARKKDQISEAMSITMHHRLVKTVHS